MALPTFGVDATTIAQRFGKQNYDDLSDRIDRWVQQASSQLDVQLKQLGFSVDTAEAQGTSGRLYLICQRYVEAVVAGDLARSNTRADPDFAKNWDRERSSILKTLRDYTESLDDSWDRYEQTGSFRPNRVNGSKFVSSVKGLKRASPRRRFWRQGRKF